LQFTSGTIKNYEVDRERLRKIGRKAGYGRKCNLKIKKNTKM